MAITHDPVALLAEGVDRNTYGLTYFTKKPVALLAEGVDRNKGVMLGGRAVMLSPSSRRAWIEI